MLGIMDSAPQARALATRVVLAVARDGRNLEDALTGAGPGPALKATVQSLAFGTIRWYPELEFCLKVLSGRPLDRLDPEVRALALVGLYQLAHGETPPHAAVGETVEATRPLGRPRAAGFINAILRRFLRERESVLATVHGNPAARFAHPAWMVQAFERDWPEHFQSILHAGNGHPPMWLRVNARRATTTDYQARLVDAGIDSVGCAFVPEALRLSRPVEVARLPGFAEGQVSVQDAAAQLAARFLDARPGMRVLDACAAPGGKACHVLELVPGLEELVALDLDPGRVGRITDNLDRLGLAATVVTGDACAPAGWWDGQPFDRILVDAPCTGTGVIRRHPDIKLLRHPGDVEAFVNRQRNLLAAVWPLLRPGGRLVYATCSVLKAENAELVEGFLSGNPEAAEVTESARLFWPAQPPVAGPGPGVALLTGAADTDGFYYACFEKRA
jgi:16S rRNA (cytosine967-C5)-methyltransferase